MGAWFLAVPQQMVPAVGGYDAGPGLPAQGERRAVPEDQAGTGDLPDMGDVDQEAALAAEEDGGGQGFLQPV